MAAYVISEVEILDERIASSHRQFAAASIAEYNGRYLSRGATAEVVEGEPTKRQRVIVAFPSMERIREWHASSADAKALRFREKAPERRLMFVEGVIPPFS